MINNYINFVSGNGYCTNMEKAGLVIFDKDGTLIKMEAGWADWTILMTNR